MTSQQLLNPVDAEYHKLCAHIMRNGFDKSDRTGTGTRSVFGYQMRFNMQLGFPILTTKKVAFNSALHETLWMFCQGSSHTKYLEDNNVKIWDEWKQNGSIGNVYGPVLRNFEVSGEQNIDQLQTCIDLIKNSPDSRRIVMTTWDPRTIADGSKTFQQNIDEGKGVLAPCHGTVIQFYVVNGYLCLQMYVRSNDIMLGCPFNIVGYALLLSMVAHICKLRVGELIYTVGDAHIYSNHFEQVDLQLTRFSFDIPQLRINRDVSNINDFKFEDFELVGYQSHPPIKASVAI